MITPPHPLDGRHRLESFTCREPTLTDWLHEHARANQAADSARTYVITAGDDLVIGYYCLSGFSVVRARATSRLSSNQPDPMPGVLIGRLAVDRRFEGLGVGESLVSDALARAATAAETIGMRAIFVDALHEDAARYWQRYGFRPLRDDPLTLYMRVDDVRATIASFGR